MIRYDRKAELNSLGLHFGMLVGVSLLVAITLPNDWSRESGPLREFTQLMVRLVPSIEKFSRVSNFPNVTETFSSLLWATLPILVITNFRIYGFKKLDHLPFLPQKWRVLVMGFIFFPAMILLPLIWIDIRPERLTEPNLVPVTRLVSHSRLALGLFAPIACWMCSVGITILIIFCRNFPRLYLNVKSNASTKG